eukprot:2719668-Amphidinium_carterae.1
MNRALRIHQSVCADCNDNRQCCVSLAVYRFRRRLVRIVMSVVHVPPGSLDHSYPTIEKHVGPPQPAGMRVSQITHTMVVDDDDDDDVNNE